MALSPILPRPIPMPHPMGKSPFDAPQARAIAQAGDHAAQSAETLSDELKRAREQSPELRLIRAMLLRGQAADTPAPAEAESDGGKTLDAYPVSNPGVSNSSVSDSSFNADLRLSASISQTVSVSVDISESGAVHVEASISQSTQVSAELRLTANAQAGRSGKQDPLVLDLDGDGIETSGLADGVSFDIDGDGISERVSVASQGNALLALDRNGNGRIDDGHELFGDQNGASHGFAELARYDDNRDGVIDRSDRVFTALRLLSFESDGSQELHSLDEAGVRALYLSYQERADILANGDDIAQQGAFARSDGSLGTAADVRLQFDARA